MKHHIKALSLKLKLSSMMSSCILWFLFLHIIHHSFSFSLARGETETDKLSLLAFKAQITDPHAKLGSWNESLHFCQWSGVTCGGQGQRVTELDLHSIQLVGSLSPHIGNLSFLRLLSLQNNSFSDAIPQELGRLVRLQTLILGNNSFSGEIPANISYCSNLLSLNLEGNNLTGNLPAGLGSLPKLQVFSFRNNHIDGMIPLSLANLSSIIKIDGTNNHLKGGIPNSIGKLKTLNFFSLGLNNLSGTIPPSLYNISALIHFSLPYNKFQGKLPPNIGLTLPNLEVFDIRDNRLSGPIPATLLNASKITQIDLSSNAFTGKVPPLASMPNLRILKVRENGLGNDEDDDLSFLYTLSNSSKLEVLDLTRNNFGGELPGMLGNLSTKLKQMTFGSNQIRGSIPDGIGNLISLEALGLERNHLSGRIPESIGKLQNLADFYLSVNKLSGSIPSSLGNITSLLQIDFDQNNLQGSIPPSLGNCRKLLVLALSQNHLSGPIPKEVLSISSLSMFLVLSENQLTGSLPFEVGKLVSLGYMDISKNNLTGEIPASLGSCESLEYLYLDGNLFQGPISESLRSLRALQDLNLSHNNLTGQIPKFLGDFKLQSLDLSFNDLEGEVPINGAFGNTSAISISGNKNLCGGILQLNLPKCKSKSKKPKSSTKLALILAIPCGFIGVIFITSFLYFFCLKKSSREIKNDQATSELLSGVPFPRVAYKDLLQATNGFSSDNLIGAGSFGSVYKGVFAFDGVIVAVKVFNLLREGASKSFTRECASLLRIRHRNLVKVLCAYAGVDFQGNDFKALVYEFMMNGSLEEWLHPIHSLDQEVHKPKNINLIQRLNIAIDVANALDYLHNQCETPIAHCDLKPSNVLLDGDMTAHVGDFGLLKFLSEASSGQTSSVGLKGTVGYAAPEYGIGSEVSTSGDVYSYGILLLEMITGKRPTDGMFKDGLELHSYVKMALPDRVVDVADPKLLIEADQIVECLISICEIGVFCSEKFPRERMDISSAVAELSRTKANFLGRRG